MKKYMVLLVFFSLSILNGFSQVIFDSIPCEKFRDPKETIKKIYLVQKANKVPKEIIVSDESIFLSYDKDLHHHITGGTTTHTWNSAIYFQDIQELRIVHDNSGRYEIRFYNKATKKNMIIFLYDKDYAIQGVCAINCMIKRQKIADKLY